MRRGTKPQRAALKVIRGSLGTRRVPKFEPRGISILDAPPAWMDAAQRAQWFYAVQNAPPGLLTGTDREVLAVWLSPASSTRVLRRRFGARVKSSKPRMATPSTILIWGIVNRQAFIMIRTAGELGLTPSARASLGMIEERGVAARA